MKKNCKWVVFSEHCVYCQQTILGYVTYAIGKYADYTVYLTTKTQFLL